MVSDKRSTLKSHKRITLKHHGAVEDYRKVMGLPMGNTGNLLIIFDVTW